MALLKDKEQGSTLVTPHTQEGVKDLTQQLSGDRDWNEGCTLKEHFDGRNSSYNVTFVRQEQSRWKKEVT